jgi:hypothetical protein
VFALKQIMWQAWNSYDNRLYTGDIDTSMTFMYHEYTNSDGTLVYYVTLSSAKELVEDYGTWYVLFAFLW